jgi:iron-sulfur cluster repair protein YtfE (RIC family)
MKKKWKGVKMVKISELMLEEHGRINSFLKRAEESLEGNKEAINKQFYLLQKELDLHFFIEENAIFKLEDKIEDVSDIFDLMKEHGEIKEIAENIKQGLEKGVEPRIKNLKEKLINHANFENKVFYPKLDEELSESEKDEILRRINKIKEKGGKNETKI